jgi:competence protein ComEC
VIDPLGPPTLPRSRHRSRRAIRTAGPTGLTVGATGDVRLLAPALTAWAVAAALLGSPSGARIVGIGVAMVLSATVAALPALTGGARRPRCRRTPAPAEVRAGRGPSPGRAAAAGAGEDRRARVVGIAHRVRWGVVLTGALVVLLQVAALAHGGWQRRGDIVALAAERATVVAMAVVTADPVVTGRHGSVRVLRDATLMSVAARGRTRAVSVPVVLAGDESLRASPWRATLRVVGRLAPSDEGGARAATLTVIGTPAVVGGPGGPARAAEHVRAGLRRAVDDAPHDPRGLLPGLVVGDTSRTPPDLVEAMRATGMTHLTAVSGSNVAVVVAMTVGCCAVLGIPRRARPWLALLAVAGFVVLARPEPSVLRAAAMGSIGLIGLSRSRQSAGLPVLGGAVVLVLVVDPWLARSFGFALSTLATLGLLLFTRPWGDAVSRWLPPHLAPLGPALAVPLAAHATTAPVVVLLQGSVSLVGVVANLLAAPLVAPATVAGVAAALVSVVSTSLADLVAWAGIIPAWGIAVIARRCADVPGGTLPWPDGAVGALLLAAVVVLFLLTGRAVVSGVRRHPVWAFGVVVVAAALMVPTRTVTWPPDGWRFVVCDVGQGDAIVLRSGPASAVLVDAGPSPPLVDGCLDRLGVTALDAVILTHFHADHIDGLTGALDGRTTGRLLVASLREPATAAAELDRLATGRGIPIGTLQVGDQVNAGDVDAVVWGPARRVAGGSAPNNNSLVLGARIGAVDALLLGDIEREAAHDLVLRLRREAWMVDAAREFEVVKTPHHGSANLDPHLLSAVRSPVAVVSVGSDNEYGHPAPGHLETLRRAGYAIYRTDRHGDVAIIGADRGGDPRAARVVTAR